MTYVAIIAGLLVATGSARAGGSWEPLGTGAGAPNNQWVNSLIVWNGQLIAMMNSGAANLDDIAAWDGTQWNSMGQGLAGSNDETIHNGLLTVDGGLLGGSRELLTWDGTTWTSVIPISVDPNGAGWGPNLASYHGKLYAGDSWYSPSLLSWWGRLWSLGVSSWEHEAWFEAGPVENEGGINIVTVLDDKLYVHVYSYTAQLHVYDGTSWSLHSNTYLMRAHDLVAVNGDLYLGGLDTIGDAYVLRWSGGAWESITDTLGYVYYDAMTVYDAKLALGDWTRVRLWDGASWTQLPGVFGGGIPLAMTEYDGDLIAAGDFTSVDSIPVNHIARYAGTVTPVAITAFTAHFQESAVLLNWQIAADETFDGFDVYRRTGDGPDAHVNTQLLPHNIRSFTDTGVIPGTTYSYLLVATGAASGEVRSQRITVEVPAAVASLEQNVPNPFNPSTTISFSIAERAVATLAVFDAAGKHVTTLARGTFDAGIHTATWDGRDDTGAAVASGIYFYRLHSGKTTLTKKMLLLK